MEGSAGTQFFSMDWGSGHEAGARRICTQLRGRRCVKYSCHVPHHTNWRCKASIVLHNAVSSFFCFSMRNRTWPREPACSTMLPTDHAKCLESISPLWIPLHSTTEGCLGQDIQGWTTFCWYGDHILGLEHISNMMSKEQYAFLLAPCLASLAQQIPINFSPEASTIDLSTGAAQPLKKHFPFTGRMLVWNRSLRSRPAPCASSMLQVNEKAPSWCRKYWSTCKTN